jgi:hypothetical protein
MQSVCEWQNEFATALVDLERPIPPMLRNPMGELSDKRFAVYRNNILRGLVEALKDMYPAACQIVGEEFFDEMAKIYVLQDPPRSPILLEYGANFARFVETFGPAAELPYLGDVCRIERAWLEAYHASEADPLSADYLSSIPPSCVGALRFTLHPSARLVQSNYPALTIWSTNIDGESPIPLDLGWGGERVLLVRPHAVVEVRSLSRSEMSFVATISSELSLLEAATIALNLDPMFFLEGVLRNLIASGVFVDFHVGPIPRANRGHNE